MNDTFEHAEGSVPLVTLHGDAVPPVQGLGGAAMISRVAAVAVALEGQWASKRFRCRQVGKPCRNKGTCDKV